MVLGVEEDRFATGKEMGPRGRPAIAGMAKPTEAQICPNGCGLRLALGCGHLGNFFLVCG